MDFNTKRHIWHDIHYATEATTRGLYHPQEPDYIASLVTKLPNDLIQILNSYIPNRQFNVGGCFIHQKPIVRFTSTQYAHHRMPELGDLLIVYKETKNNEDRYNALLLQAKKTDNIYNTHIRHYDQHQYVLYTKWPKFEYHRAGRLNGVSRSISPKTITSGAQYLLIDEQHNAAHWHYPVTFWCAGADNPLEASSSLATALLQLIEFQTGRPFVAKGRNIDQWSKMIWDLLDISTQSIFNRRRNGYNNHPRHTGDIITYLATLNNVENFVENEENGISIICIEGKYIEERANVFEGE